MLVHIVGRAAEGCILVYRRLGILIMFYTYFCHVALTDTILAAILQIIKEN